jgi:hypothetical protein
MVWVVFFVGWADLGRGVGCYGAGLLRWTGKAFPPFLISNFYLLFLFSVFYLLV